MTKDQILESLQAAIANIQNLATVDEQIELINDIRLSLHQVSPMRHEPVDLVLWVKNQTVEANDYNPNSVAPPEMKLLEVSILEDGYTQPIVTYDEHTKRTVVDGFHRNRVGKESEKVRERVHGYLPVVTINEEKTGKDNRIASTIRHNRARGKHKVDSMSDIVVDLKRRNWSDEKIARELGMDPDEILRLSQISGLTEMFEDKEFSEAWEAEVIDESDNLQTFEENV
jgi:ParB-like chromosome segregation protein Spo0J